MKLLKHLALLGACLALPVNTANALSCSPKGFNLKDVYNSHAASQDTYTFIVGKFISGSKNIQNIERKTKTYLFTFKGSIIGRSSLTQTQREVLFDSNCIASWCGPLPENGREVIAAAKIMNDGSYRVISGPCSPNQFSNDIQSKVKTIQTCMSSGICQ